jgi:hypothetical protein
MVPELLTLIANYKVMIYSGNLDIIVGAPLTEGFMSKLDFNGSVAFHAAPRVPYKEVGSEEVAGYFKHAGNLTQVVVRGAGHILPHDQPQRVLLVCVPLAPLSHHACLTSRASDARMLLGFCCSLLLLTSCVSRAVIPISFPIFSLLPSFPPSLLPSPSLPPVLLSLSPPWSLRH